MSLTKKLNIPNQMNTGFNQIFKLSDEVLQRLEDALKSVSPQLDGNEFTAAVADKSKLEEQDISEILRVLISLYLGRTTGRVSIEEFVDSICSTLAEKKDDSVKPADGNWQPFKERLNRLLAFDQSIGITAKALSIMTEHERVFLTGESRILTDIRPVFTDDAGASPSSAVIIHTLKIGYMKDEDVHQFFIALDSQDLRDLLEILKRAEAKEQSLQPLLESAHIRHLSPLEE